MAAASRRGVLACASTWGCPHSAAVRLPLTTLQSWQLSASFRRGWTRREHEVGCAPVQRPTSRCGSGAAVPELLQHIRSDFPPAQLASLVCHSGNLRFCRAAVSNLTRSTSMRLTGAQSSHRLAQMSTLPMRERKLGGATALLACDAGTERGGAADWRFCADDGSLLAAAVPDGLARLDGRVGEHQGVMTSPASRSSTRTRATPVVREPGSSFKATTTRLKQCAQSRFQIRFLSRFDNDL